MKKDKIQSRNEMVERINEYLRNGKDDLIYLVDSFMFKWHTKQYNSGYRRLNTIRATGKFDGNFDYGRGIVQLNVSVLPSGQENKVDFHFSITNIDDGNWDIFKTFDSVEEANDFTDKFIAFWSENIDETYGFSLPAENDLNLILCKIGLWGELTG